jgi:hypothetical protein
MIPPQAAAELTAQHLVLVAQHQQLGIRGQVRADRRWRPEGNADERASHREDDPNP